MGDPVTVYGSIWKGVLGLLKARENFKNKICPLGRNFIISDVGVRRD